MTKQIRRHALHEKALQRQKGVGTMVSSQEQTALLVPPINRRRTADEPLMDRGSNAGFDISSVSFPGHAWHEKGLQRQTGVGTLVSIQERRVLLVPVINRL